MWCGNEKKMRTNSNIFKQDLPFSFLVRVECGPLWSDVLGKLGTSRDNIVGTHLSCPKLQDFVCMYQCTSCTGGRSNFFLTRHPFSTAEQSKAVGMHEEAGDSSSMSKR